MKLSQCMIVKNEEKNIRKALSWGKDLADEQIVVDTGSTDHTVQIAKEMGAAVYTFTWVNDFAKAKNYAISKAAGDWILFLDADEYIAERDVKKIPSILKKAQEKQLSVIQSSWVQLGEHERVMGTFIQWRIFKNSSNIRYQGAIHEQLYDTAGKPLRIAKAEKELAIFHTGYNWNQVDRIGKGSRNIELIKQELAKNPSYSVMNYYMAESLNTSGKIQEALSYAEIALKNKDGLLPDDVKASLYQTVLYGLYSQMPEDEGKEEKMYALYLDATDFYPNYPDYDVTMAFLNYDKQEWEKAIFYFKQALQKTAQMPDNSYSHIAVYLDRIYFGLASSLIYLKRFRESVTYIIPYLKEFDRYNDSALTLLIRALFLDGSTLPADAVTFLNKLYDLEQPKDLLFILKSVKQSGWGEMENECKKLLSDKQIKLLYPKRENLQKYYPDVMTSIDHDFFQLAELIQNTSKTVLIEQMEQIQKELKTNDINSFFQVAKKLCGKMLWNEKKVTEKLNKKTEEYAKEMSGHISEYANLYRTLADDFSRETLYLVIRGWLTMQNDLFEIAANKTSLPLERKAFQSKLDRLKFNTIDDALHELTENNIDFESITPAVSICVSLTNGDLRIIPEYLRKLRPDYNIYLRYYKSGELILYGE